MRMLIFLSSMLVILNTWAQERVGSNHGYLILDNGKIYTSRTYFPSSDLVPMFQPLDYFMLPEMVDHKGTNFFIDEDDALYTTDTDGWLYLKRHYLDGKSVSKAGGSFFITRDGGGHIVKNDGLVEEHFAEGFELFKEARLLGGVFFITRRSELYVANPYDGKFYKGGETFDEKVRKVKVVGHNYFITKKGNLYTVGFRKVPKGEGHVHVPVINKISNKEVFKNIKLAGGNFFFDENNNIHTVSAQGILNTGVYDREMKVVIPAVNKDRSQDTPEHLGGNYFIYPDGEVYMVDDQGYFYYLKDFAYYERVGLTNSLNQ